MSRFEAGYRSVKRLGKAWAGILAASMMLLLIPLLLPAPLQAGVTSPRIVLYTPAQNGNLFIVKGFASFTSPPGQPSQYHVQVVWEHEGTVVFQNDLAELPPLRDMGGGKYEFNFTDSQALNTSGEWVVRARLYHQQPPGNDNQADAFATIIIETFTVSVTTEPGGLSITVDGAVYASPQTFTWLSGSVHTIGTVSPQLGDGMIYTWVSWSDGGGISHTVSTSSDAVYVAYFKKQFSVGFSQTGLDDSATGTVVTVNGVSKSMVELPFSNWYDEDASISYDYATIVESSEPGKRFSLRSITGPASPFRVTAPTLVTGNYATQYCLNVRTEPEGLAAIPGGGWFDANSFIALTAPEQILVSQGVRYRFSHWSVDGASQGSGVNQVTVKMDMPHTAIAHYVLQYYLSVNSPHGEPSPESGWFDAGTVITASVTSPWPVDAVDTRSFCTGWTGTGSIPPSGAGTTVTFTIDAPSSITWTWKTQFRVSFTQTGVEGDFTGVVVTVDGADYGREGYAAWYDAGASIVFTYRSLLVAAANRKQYVLTGVDASTPLIVTGPDTVTGSYKTQYYVEVSTSHGTVSPESGWFDAGSTVAIAAAAPPTVEGERFTWLGWVGTGSGSYTGMENPGQITVNSPISETASWAHQYYLTVDSPYGTVGGEGWYDEGSTAYATVAPLTVDGPEGARYVFTHWSGDASGTISPSNPITMDRPKTAVAYWKTQFSIVFAQEGLDETAAGTVVSIDGSAKTISSLPFTAWVDNGASVSYVFEDAVSSSAPGRRFRLNSVNGPASPIIVTAPLTVTGSYVSQYEVTFTQSMLDETATGVIVTVDGVGKTMADLPFTGWFDSGATYSYSSIVPSTEPGKRFMLESVTGPASPITGPGTVTGVYVPQYRLVFTQTGLDNTATGTVVTVNGAPKTILEIPFTTGWFDHGSLVYFEYSDPAASLVEGKRFRLVSVSHASPLTVTQPVTVTGNYATQWLVAFTVNPPDAGATFPSGADWYDAGAQIRVSAEANAGYSFSEWSVNTPLITVADASSKQTIVTVNGQGTVTACFTPFYTVSFTQAGLPPGTEWSVTLNGATKFSTGTVIVFSDILPGDYSWSVSTPIYADPGVRYVASPSSGTVSVPSQLTQTIVFTAQYRVAISWSGLGADADGGKVATITVGGTVYTKNAGDAFYEEWVDTGTTVSYSYEEFASTAVDGERYRLYSVSGSSESISHDFGPVSGPVYETAYYKAQYYIEVVSAHGSPTASSWVDEGSSFTASVTSPAETMVNDHQWVCTGFRVDENPVQEGVSHTFASVEAPHTIVFYWRQQFWIQVNSAHGSPTPSQWVDQGGSLAASVASPADESDGARFRCTGYTLDSNPPVEDGSTSHVFTNVQSAHTITFNWITQYRVTFYTNPEGGSINVGGVVKNNGESEFYDEGAVVPVAPSAPAGYWFSSWTVTGGVTVEDPASQTTVMRVGGAGSLSANFVVNTVSITVTSSPVTGGGFIRVDGAPYATPAAFTWVIGSTHVLEAVSTVSGPAGTRYVWTGWSDGGAQTHVYTVPSTPETVTACFKTQHYLNVVSPHDTPGGSGWYDEGSTAYATLEAGSVVENGVQYLFTGWSGDASGTGLTSSPIVMNAPKTAVANWVAGAYTVTFDKSPRQGVITVDGTVYTSLPVVLQWVPGSSHEVVAPETEEAGGTRYVFREWSDGSTRASRTIVADTPGAVYTAYYNVQHRLTVRSEHGVTTGSGWYDEGVEAVFSVSPTVVRDESEGVEYRFKGWVGSGAGSCYTGPDNPARVLMTGPVEETAEWEPTMYYLKVVSEYGDPYGSGWYPANSEARFGVNTPVNHGNGTLRVFLAWSGDIGLREPAGTLLMVKPYTVIAGWDTQYLVVYNTTAPNGVLLSIPRVPQTLPPGFNVYATYYPAGSSVEVGPAPETVYGTEDVRYCFEGWAIDGKPVASNLNLTFTVDKPLNVSVIYGTEVLLTVNVVGVSQPYTVRLTVEKSPAHVFDITPESPFREWVRKDSAVTLTVSSPNKIGRGEWAVFREWAGDVQGVQKTVSFKASGPTTVNAVFFAVNPVAQSIPFSLLAGLVSTVVSRLIRRRYGEEQRRFRRYSPTLAVMSLMAVLAAAAIVSSAVATGYGISAWELPDFTNWAVVFTAVEAAVFLAATLLATRLAYPRRIEIPAIYPNPYGI